VENLTRRERKSLTGVSNPGHDAGAFDGALVQAASDRAMTTIATTTSLRTLVIPSETSRLSMTGPRSYWHRACSRSQ